MSRFEIDDQFLTHHKVVRAIRSGAESIQMWLALRTYSAVNNSDGIVPDEDINDLPGAPKNPRKWLKILVDCGKPNTDGTRGPGLVDEVDEGWKLHDYQDHGLSSQEIERRRQLSRDRQKKWRESRIDNASRNALHNAHSSVTNNASTNASRDASGDAPDPIRSDLSLSLKNKTAVQDLSGSDACARVSIRQQQQTKSKATPEKIPCPADLVLLDGQIANLEMAGIPRWAIDLITRDMVGKFLADTEHPRSRADWLKSLSRAVSGEWNSGRRPKKPDPNALPPKSERTWLTAEEAGLPS